MKKKFAQKIVTFFAQSKCILYDYKICPLFRATNVQLCRFEFRKIDVISKMICVILGSVRYESFTEYCLVHFKLMQNLVIHFYSQFAFFLYVM